MNIKAVVFDIGGTLMEYRNMPNVWIDYYKTGFEFVRDKLGFDISDGDIEKSIEVLKSYNPKVKYREEDIAPEVIFGEACGHWKCPFKLDEVIDVFYRSMGLTPYIYPETIDVLEMLKVQGYIIAALTDVATGMPDELHKSYFPELMPYFDMYVSSLSCGMRKPNPKGLRDIADRFGISPDEMIFVGDEEKDIKTAERFGCKSVLIDRKGSGKQYGQWYTIDDLYGIWTVILNTYEMKFCARCGRPLAYKSVGDEGRQRYCPCCDKFYFDDPACCVLAAIINENNQVLLLKQNYISEEKYTLCSGYVKKGETLEETIEREVMEETGCTVSKCEYVDSYYYPQKGLIMPGFIVRVEEKYRLPFKSMEVDGTLWADLDKAADMILRVNNLSGVHLDNVIEKITGKHPLKGRVSTEYFVAFMDFHGQFNVAFDDNMIYDGSDAYDFEKAAERVIKPEKKYANSFTKDNITVTYSAIFDSFYGYWWKTVTETEEEEKKVLEWASAASEEFMKQKGKALSENKENTKKGKGNSHDI